MVVGVGVGVGNVFAKGSGCAVFWDGGGSGGGGGGGAIMALLLRCVFTVLCDSNGVAMVV